MGMFDKIKVKYLADGRRGRVFLCFVFVCVCVCVSYIFLLSSASLASLELISSAATRASQNPPPPPTTQGGGSGGWKPGGEEGGADMNQQAASHVSFVGLLKFGTRVVCGFCAPRGFLSRPFTSLSFDSSLTREGSPPCH